LRSITLQCAGLSAAALFFTIAAQAAHCSPAAGGTEAVQDWHRVAYDNAGVAGQQEHLLSGGSYRYPEKDLALSVTGADNPSRFVAFGERVVFGYAGMKEKARYKARLTFMSDGPREQRISMNGKALEKSVMLEKGGLLRIDLDLPTQGSDAPDTMTIEITRIAGPNAVISEIEILSSDPVALAPAEKPGLLTVEERSSIKKNFKKLMPRLTPRPMRTQGTASPQMTLNGSWSFNAKPDDNFWKMRNQGSGWYEVVVPAEWAMQGFEVEPGTAAAYLKSFELPPDWAGKRVKLRFDAVYSLCTVWVNGKEAGRHEGGFTPFELDVTGLVHKGVNWIALSVQNESMADTIASGTQYAAHQLGGITRKVTLFALPQVHVADLFIQTKFDEEYSDATVHAALKIVNESESDCVDLECCITISPWGEHENAKSLAEACVRIPKIPADGVIDKVIEIPVCNPAKWDPEHPNLHTLSCALSSGSAPLATIQERFGFRDVGIRSGRVFVNNKPVKLRGICRHEVHPLLGRALTQKQWRKDAELFRGCNINYIRTSHYPPAEEFIDLCDELGLFVELEAPICWVGHAANMSWKRWKYTDEKFASLITRANLETIAGHRNNPSVIIRSLANESLWSRNFALAACHVRLADPSRLFSFHDQCWGGYNNLGSAEMDVANIHYPGPDGPARTDSTTRPVLFGEYCHLNTYNREEITADPGVREAYGRALKSMWDEMYAHSGCLGGAIWSGVDDVFLLPSGKVVGYGEWGPIDGWRRTKPEYHHITKAYSPVRIHERFFTVPEDGAPLRIKVENRHDFTNLKELDIRWSLGGSEGAATADVPPHSFGELLIPTRLGSTDENNELALTFVSPRGFVIDEYLLRPLIKPGTDAAHQEKLPQDTTANLKVEVSPEEITVSGKGFTWRISAVSGKVIEGRAGDETVFTGGPHLMILPLKTGPCKTEHSAKIPPFNRTCAGWSVQGVETVKTGGGVEIKVRGGYAEANGSYTLKIDRTGGLTLDYSFVCQHEINPRQAGMVMDLCADFSVLDWERNAFWTVYPDDHIGRAQGTAIASRGQQHRDIPRLNPKWPWAWDENEMGSCDFRATRTGIKRAWFTSDSGKKVFIESDGTQALRAYLNNTKTSFLVACLDTGGADMFLSSHYKKERITLKKGSVIEDTIRLHY